MSKHKSEDYKIMAIKYYLEMILIILKHDIYLSVLKEVWKYGLKDMKS